MKQFISKYKHAWVFLYCPIYLICFFYLEKTVTTEFNLIHVPLDDRIPFVEQFIVPYILWYAFVAVGVAYFFFTNQQDFYRMAAFLFVGMTAFLVISAIYPNGLMLRPDLAGRDNIYIDLVKALHSVDTPTNVFPSIHVYNTLGVWIAIAKSKTLQKYKWIQIASTILSISIILSTMFLKQHSVVDVVGAFVLGAVVYIFVYVIEPKRTATLTEKLS